MALLTSLPFSEAAQLAAKYGVSLREVVPLVSGSVNSNFFLKAHDGQEFFARLYEEQSDEGAQFELRLNEILAEAGIPVARPLRTLAGELCLAFRADDGRRLPFSIYGRVFGDVLCTDRVRPRHTHRLGEALARVHSAPLGDLRLPESRFGVDGLRRRLEQIASSGRPELVSAGNLLTELLGRTEREKDPNLPRGLIHGDLFRDNALFDGDTLVALLDFESASRGTFMFDLAVTGLAWCYGAEFKLDCLAALFEGYHSVRPFGPVERRGLELEAKSACVRFAITRITDFSMRVAEDEAPKRDYRRFLERFRAIEEGAFARALSAL